MDKKTKNKIIAALRKLTYSHKPRSNAKRKMKVAPATYQCEYCGIIIYEGTKELEHTDLEKQYKKSDIRKGKTYMDHKIPIIDPTKGWSGWNEYIERMFCDETGFQVLCKDCHDVKTFREDLLRKKVKALRSNMEKLNKGRK